MSGICVGSFDPASRIQLAVTTDETGSYTLNGLRPGEHRIAFVDCNEAPSFAVAWWHTSRSFSGATNLVLTAGEVRDGVGAAVVPGGPISGRVVTSDGQPVGEVCAIVVADDGGLMTYVVTGTDGRYAAWGLRSGDHRVLFIDCSSWDPRFEERWYDARTSFETGDPVSVREPARIDDIDAVLTPVGSTHPEDPAAPEAPLDVEQPPPPEVDGPPTSEDQPPPPESDGPPVSDDLPGVPRRSLGPAAWWMWSATPTRLPSTAW